MKPWRVVGKVKEAQTPCRAILLLPCIHCPLTKVWAQDSSSCLGWWLVLTHVLGIHAECWLYGRYRSRHGGHAETNLQAKTETKIISCRPSSVITTATGCAERRAVCCAHGELWLWVKHWEAPGTKCKECVESNRGNKRRCGSLGLRADQHHLLGLALEPWLEVARKWGRTVTQTHIQQSWERGGGSVHTLREDLLPLEPGTPACSVGPPPGWG